MDGDTSKKIGWIIAIIVVVVAIGYWALPASASCGDYDRADVEDFAVDGDRLEKGNDGHEYEHDPGDGEYRKNGPGEFEYVGCSDGSRGSSGSGGLFRGGGPGSGK